MNSMNRHFVALLTVALVGAGCSRRPKSVLPEDEMVGIMAEIQIAEAYDRNGEAYGKPYSPDRELLGRGVMKAHGVTPEQMDSTLAWYGRNMDEYAKLYAKVDRRLGEMQRKYARAAGEALNSEPSADLWPYGRHFSIDGRTLTNGLTAIIQMPDIMPGEKLIWKMRTQGTGQRNVTLGVDYEDGTTELVRTSLNGTEPWTETSIQTDTLLKVNRIFASADFERQGARVLIDSLQLIHQPYSEEEYARKGYQRRIFPATRTTSVPPDTTSNSSLTPDSISVIPSSSTGKSLGERMRGKRLKPLP